jgi:DNA-binding response OmpR family regulator
VAILDDDRAHLAVLEDVLEGEGYTPLLQDDLRQGYLFVRDTAPALVIVDLLQGRRPVGLEVIQRLQADPATCAVPIIVVSADSGTLEWYAPTWAAAGIQALEKPYELDDLLALVHAAVALGQSAPEASPGPHGQSAAEA